MAPDGAAASSASTHARAADRLGRRADENLFSSFHDYCGARGSTRRRCAGASARDPAARELLIALEKGELARGRVRAAARARCWASSPTADRRPVRGRATRRGDGRGRPPRARRRHSHGARVELVGRAPLPARPVRRAVRRRRDLRRGGHPQACAAHVRARRRARRRAAGACVYVDDLPFNLDAGRRSWAWPPCTTRAPSRRSPSSNACSALGRCAQDRRASERTTARPRSQASWLRRRTVALPRPYRNLKKPASSRECARLVRVHEQFALDRQLRRDDDRLLGAVLADAARAVARAEAGRLGAAHRQLEHGVVDHRVVDVRRARLRCAARSARRARCRVVNTDAPRP